MSKKAGKLTALLLTGMMLAAPLAEVTVYADEPGTIPEEAELTGGILTEDEAEEVLTEDASEDELLLDRLDGQVPDGEAAEEIDADGDDDPFEGHPWSGMAKEFFPYYVMGETGEEADGKVTTAYLKDNGSGEDDQNGLVESGSYKVLSVTPDMDKGEIDVEITAKGLKEHKNADPDDSRNVGHWIGVAIPIIPVLDENGEEKYTVTYNPSLTFKTEDELQSREFLPGIVSEYTDDAGNRTHVTSYIGFEQLIAQNQDEYSYYINLRFTEIASGAKIHTRYKIIFKDVTLKEEKVEDISVSPKSTTVGVGGTIQLETEVTPSYAADKSLEFTSDHPEIAEVDNEGWVTGKSEGKATIKIKAKDGSEEEATAIITVKAKKKQDQTITVEDEFEKVVGDEPFDLEAETDGDGQLSYTSSNTDIVTVSRNGLATVKKVGTAMITITASETDKYNKAEKKVKVIVSKKAKIDQKIIAKDQTATVGDDSFALEVETIGDGELSFSSSDTKVVTIGAKTGLVKVVGAGTATITITAAETEEYNKAVKKVKVTVSAKTKKNQTIKASDQTATVGDEPFELEAETSGDGALSFSSGNTKVVTIGAKSGLVKVVGAGTATITITAAETEKYNKATKTVKITVSPKSDIHDKTDISGATVTGIKKLAYTGKKLRQDPTVKLNGKKLTRGKDYKIVYQGNRTNVGKATFLVKGMGSYTGSIKKTFTIMRAKNPMKVKGKKVNVGAGTIAEKSRTIAADKFFKVSKNKGKVTYKKVKGLQKITVASDGKVTLKPGIKKGPHSVKVKITAAGDKNYRKLTKSAVFTVVIK